MGQEVTAKHSKGELESARFWDHVSINAILRSTSSHSQQDGSVCNFQKSIINTAEKSWSFFDQEKKRKGTFFAKLSGGSYSILTLL